MDFNLTSEALGLKTPPQKTRVVVAMSGGVDSSVTAALLVEAGFEVVGITLQLYDHGQALKKKKACCAGQDIYDARQVADTLGIPHYVLDYESKFQNSVIDNFVDDYVQGRTPLPCVRCNQTVKFHDLLKMAKEDLNAAALATGHYAQWVPGLHGAELHRGADHQRDQSFFLFTTTQEQLDFIRFPLGNVSKSVTRDYARRLGLKTADKPDSQDICFVPEGKYADLITRLRPGAMDAGDILHVDGRVLGQHEGTLNYTIGQRRGIGVGGESEPLYVIRIDPEKRHVIVGPKEYLAVPEITLNQVNWLGGAVEFNIPQTLQVKIRSTQAPVPAYLTLKSPTHAVVRFETPEYGVAPGQACVFYQQDRVLGGGWISPTQPC